MAASTIVRFILFLLLCFVIAEIEAGNGRRRGNCAAPAKYRHLPPASCANRRGRRTLLQHHRQKRANYLTYRETRSDNEIINEHNNLITGGYTFIGWHGTSAAAGRNLVGGDRFRLEERTGDDRVWMGVYTTNSVDIAKGYLQADSVLLRVYVQLLSNAVHNAFVDATDINNAVKTPSFCNHNNPSYQAMMAGRGQYVICGPDGTEQEGVELVASQDLIPNVKFLYSAHNKDLVLESRARYACPSLQHNSNAIESTFISWQLNSNTAFINSLRAGAAQVFRQRGRG